MVSWSIEVYLILNTLFSLVYMPKNTHQPGMYVSDAISSLDSGFGNFKEVSNWSCPVRYDRISNQWWNLKIILDKDPDIYKQLIFESFPPAFQNAKYSSFWMNPPGWQPISSLLAQLGQSRCYPCPSHGFPTPPSHTLTAGNTCTVDFSSQGPCMWIHGTGIVDPAFTIKNHTQIWVNITYMDPKIST